ncbi:MAG: MCE family protein [Proteobacteria bacterium]|nr:MCE family protein [Pseudomonadota bacterium]MCP4918789.1 MCE family protein [Pseudomonadota bacterium]
MSRKHEIGVGLLVLGATGLLGWMAIQVGSVGQLGDTVDVVAVFDDASGLKEGAAIAIAGVEVGRVGTLEVAFDKANVPLSISADADVRDDVIVVLRARSVLGEKYVELVPQDPGAPLLASGTVLTDTRGQYEIDQFVTGLEPLLASLDPQAVDQIVTPLVSALEADPERPARMLENLDATLANVREASEEAPALVREARQTMTDVRRVSAKAEVVAERADAVLVDLEEVTADLPASADRLPGLLDEAEATLTEARSTLETVNGSSESLAKVLHNFEDIDKWELRRLLREEGIVIRLTPSDVEPTD